MKVDVILNGEKLKCEIMQFVSKDFVVLFSPEKGIFFSKAIKDITVTPSNKQKLKD